MGGGSVIDSAKVVSVFSETKNFGFVESLVRNKTGKEKYSLAPIIAIPTTAGTGSEVTPWATIWDMDEKKKYSLHLPDLWCVTAIGDPTLTLSMPKDITIQTGLDALSHSLEAIWNKNANSTSTNYAIKAAKEIIEVLPLLVDDLNNIELRSRMLKASLEAGLAFSNTQTAIAHAISYYLTAQRGTPHGVACSFSLPAIIKQVMGFNSQIDQSLVQIFGDLSSEPIRKMYQNINYNYKNYYSKIDFECLYSSVVDSARSKNFIFDNSITEAILNEMKIEGNNDK